MPPSTLKLRVVQARYGDCLILQFGAGKRRKHVLIDGGPSGVYGPYLRAELEEISAAGGQIDLMVLSHIDNDHVLGLLEFMRDLRDAGVNNQPWLIPVRRMWHNGFGKVMPEAGSEAAALEEEAMVDTGSEDPGLSFGVGEGIRLQLAEELLSIPRDFAFKDGLVRVAKKPQPVRLAGLRMWMLGPSLENLDALREKWFKWLQTKRGEISFGEGPAVKPDDSVNNLSSIMFLAEMGGRRILLTGDGRSEDIIAGLEQAGLMAPGGTTHVDILKVPHHGSARNCVGELFDRVQADTYVISADGHHGNPDWDTLEWLVDAACRQNRDIHIFATNPTDTLDRLVRQRPGPANHYTLTILEKGKRSAIL